MGLICNQLEGTLNDEVNIEDNQNTTNSLSNTPKRRRKLVKQSTHKPKNFLHSLFKWYFKSRAALQDDYSKSATGDYEISIDALNCSEDESSLAYRQHKVVTTSAKASQAPSPSSSNLSHSHYLVRQSICLYAASSVILALCYLATPSSATTETPSHPV